jgi:hypothetical protein
MRPYLRKPNYVTKTKMAARITIFLENVWAKEPGLVVSFTIWALL